MTIIDSDGNYQYVPGTKMLQVSTHPVHQARIEIALPKGAWLYAPTSGHDLLRFQKELQTPAKTEEFQKELSHYLRRYSPAVTESLIGRGAVEMDLTISQDALNG